MFVHLMIDFSLETYKTPTNVTANAMLGNLNNLKAPIGLTNRVFFFVISSCVGFCASISLSISSSGCSVLFELLLIDFSVIPAIGATGGLALQVSGRKKTMPNHVKKTKIDRNQNVLLQPRP